MSNWSRFSNDEIERRRASSVDALRAQDREAFDLWYQEQCDRLYWQSGPCCAGCDHWRSDMGNLGECVASGIVSGDQVMASLGILSCSYTLPPGFPLTRAEFRCGLFKDDFDWSTLDRDYLSRICAIRNGRLKSKPRTPTQQEPRHE